MNNKNDEMGNGKEFHFFFNHNNNKNIKTINKNNPISKSIDDKRLIIFGQNNQNNSNQKTIKRDIRGYPISVNYNKRYTNTKLEQNLLANSTNLELNTETILNQISQLIDKKKNLNNNNNINNINISHQQINNPQNQNTIKIKKDFSGKCFQNIKITSIPNQKFVEKKKENQNKDFEINNHEYTPIGRSVISFSYNEDINKHNRKEMQDIHKIIDKYMNSNNKGYFSLFDGHGKGINEPIKYAASRLPNIFSNFLISTHYNIEKSFIYSFQKIDDELKCYSEIENCGSTATILYIDKENEIIYSANVGDSKSILINKNKNYKNLTTEHKCINNNEEVQRIKNLGGLVFNGRLFGQLALTRALGDFSLKNNGLISTPSIYKVKILDDDIFIVIASDGVWDALSESDVCNICIDNKNLNVDDLGKLIIKSSLEKGSEDNISCIVIQVNSIANV